MLRRTPLYSRHEAQGARFVPFAGFSMPVQYSGLKPEHLAVRSGVGLFDVSHMGEVRVRGPGAVVALEWLFSNHVGNLALGQARYGLLCDERGGIVDDVIVYRCAEDDFLVCVNAANRDKDFAWMQANVPAGAEVEITDEGDDWAQIAVQGPKSEATLQPLTGVDLAELAYYHFTEATVAGVEGCLVARTGYTGEDGFEVFTPAAGAEAVWDALMECGAPQGVVPVGLGARDTLRLEVCYPLYGHELSSETSPRMARLMWVTKLGKEGGFLGADAIRDRKDTDSDVLVRVTIDGPRIVRDGMKVLRDGEEVGVVTSGTRSPSLDVGIALAYVPKAMSAPGTSLTFDVRGRTETGTVVKDAFYQRGS